MTITRMCHEEDHAKCASMGAEVSTIVRTGPKTVAWGEHVPCECECHKEHTDESD